MGCSQGIDPNFHQRVKMNNLITADILISTYNSTTSNPGIRYSDLQNSDSRLYKVTPISRPLNVIFGRVSLLLQIHNHGYQFTIYDSLAFTFYCGFLPINFVIKFSF
ncbi:hypothetical protein K501DRAFT_275958 [Backusella circina FSU 941]|nr:hypothetical protein K501DRAFT_275958 [Backusella circina FSU 941]